MACFWRPLKTEIIAKENFLFNNLIDPKSSVGQVTPGLSVHRLIVIPLMMSSE